MKTKSLSLWRKTCDKLFQQRGREKFSKSILSGQSTQVIHHLIAKSCSSALRYDWDNAIPLTNGEHYRLHRSGDPTYEWKIIKIKGGDEWYENLKKRGQKIMKINIGYYRNIFKELSK